MMFFQILKSCGMSNGRGSFAAAMAVAVLLGGCASGTTMVLQPYSKPAGQIFETVLVVQGENTVDVPEEIETHFGTRLKEYLYEDGRFAEGDDLRIEYRFIQMDEGSRAARYFIGFGAGKGQMTVEVRYFDVSGTELSRIQVSGEISGGILGGDFDEAVSRAAKEVSEYTKEKF